jgi:hypothetical protein
MSLAVQEAARNVPLVRDTLELVKDVVNFIRASPLRLRTFDAIRAQFDTGDMRVTSLRPFCPTR